MDIEQLKLILETINAAGAGAQTLVLVYLGYALLRLVLILALLAGLAAGAYRLFANALSKDRLEHEIAKALDTYRPLSPIERDRAVTWLLLGKAAERAQKDAKKAPPISFTES